MKQKLLFLLLFSFLISALSFSQDMMIMKTGEEIKVKILEVLPDVVKYKKWDNQDGPSYTEYKTNIFMIKYQNGSKDVFASAQAASPAAGTGTANPNEETRKSQAIEKLGKIAAARFDDNEAIRFISFNKTNGIMRNVFGQAVYEIEFEIAAQFKIDGWTVGSYFEGYWNSSFKVYTSAPSLGAFSLQEAQYYPAGTAMVFGCSASMENTDNGYELKEFKLHTVRNLGVMGMQSSGSMKEISSQPVDLSVFAKPLKTPEKTHFVTIAEIAVTDELKNSSEVQLKFIEILSNIKRFSAADEAATDSLELQSQISFSYQNSATSNSLFIGNFILDVSLVRAGTGEELCKNRYATAHDASSKAYFSKLDAERNLLSVDLKQHLHQFLIGNFPIHGEIVEITQASRKKDEAKMVKINLGRKDGINKGFYFSVEGVTPLTSNGDILVETVFEDYCICKVTGNHKQIAETSNKGEKLLIVTRYKPGFQGK